MKDYTSLHVTVAEGIAHVELARPEKANALGAESWKEIPDCFNELSKLPACRVVVISGQGKHFCAGIDLSFLMQVGQSSQNDCEGRRRESLRDMIFELQAAFNAIDECKKPVIAAVHGGCIGAGVDLVTACDMRYATDDAYFQVKEIDIGMVADVGTLQRLPKVIADGHAREMAYTGRKVPGTEAASIGLANASFSTREELIEEVMKVAANISSKSPLSIRGTKEMLRYSRDHSVEDGLKYIATWNSAMLLSEDLAAAMQASMMKQTPAFRD